MLAVFAVGCAQQPVYITRTEIQRIPTPIIIPIADEFIEPLVVRELPEDLNNRDLEADIEVLEAVVDTCQDDRKALRERQEDQDAH